MARFGNANEHADWETAHHVFTYANALDQLIKRIGSGCDSNATAVRGVLHGAMALYLSRYLNVPPARIPGEGGDQLDDLPSDPEAMPRSDGSLDQRALAQLSLRRNPRLRTHEAGAYMREADAQATGNRAAKNESHP